MSSYILTGSGREIHPVPDDSFIQSMRDVPSGLASRLEFMSRDHHLVRDFVVREMPRQSSPLSPLQIAQDTDLPLDSVKAILADLERHLFFLVRDAKGNVNWAFPVTTTQTPHRLSFSTGENTSGAWAEDAFATSFVQGRLRGEKLRVRIDSECRHCSQPLTIEVDDELNWQLVSPGASPLLFEPAIEWSTFHGTNIIHDYWKQTVFFWSEEHARDYRRSQKQPDGTYLTLSQAAFAERYAQSGLFAISPDGRLLR